MKKFKVPPRTLPPVCDLIDGIGSEGKRRLPRLHPSNFEPTTPGRIYKPASTPNNAPKLDSKGNKVSSNQRLIFLVIAVLLTLTIFILLYTNIVNINHVFVPTYTIPIYINNIFVYIYYKIELINNFINTTISYKMNVYGFLWFIVLHIIT